MNNVEHDKELYKQALDLGYDYSEYVRLESLCLTKEGADAIHSLMVTRYHYEEAASDMI